MPNKNSLKAIKKGCTQVKWHDTNLLATRVSDIGLQPSMNYAKHKAS